MKKDKLIGLSESDKKELSIMAVNVGISLKAYCERVLERHVAENTITDNTDNSTYPKTPKESFKKPLTDDDTIVDMKPGKLTVTKKKKKPVKIGNTTLVPLDEFGDNPTMGDDQPKFRSIKDDMGMMTPKEVKQVAENMVDHTDKIFEIPKSDSMDKSGKFDRLEPKIYTNGKVFEYRDFINGEGLVKKYYNTLEEAREAKSKK